MWPGAASPGSVRRRCRRQRWRHGWSGSLAEGSTRYGRSGVTVRLGLAVCELLLIENVYLQRAGGEPLACGAALRVAGRAGVLRRRCFARTRCCSTRRRSAFASARTAGDDDGLADAGGGGGAGPAVAADAAAFAHGGVPQRDADPERARAACAGRRGGGVPAVRCGLGVAGAGQPGVRGADGAGGDGHVGVGAVACCGAWSCSTSLPSATTTSGSGWPASARCRATASGGRTALHSRVIQSMADVVDSPAACCSCGTPGRGRSSGRGPGTCRRRRGGAGGPPAIQAMQGGGWIARLDGLRERRRWTAVRASLDGAWRPLWLAVPLVHRRRADRARAARRRRAAPFELEQEVFDLLRIVGQEVATYVAEQRATQVLLQTRQLHDYGKRFAFVAHDIKNVSSQLALLLSNAEQPYQQPGVPEGHAGHHRGVGEQDHGAAAPAGRARPRTGRRMRSRRCRGWKSWWRRTGACARRL